MGRPCAASDGERPCEFVRARSLAPLRVLANTPTTSMKRLLLLSVLVTWLGSSANLARAHDPGLSEATVQIEATRTVIHLRYPLADLATLISSTDSATLTQFATQILRWRGSDQDIPFTVLNAALSDATTVEFTIELPRVSGTFDSQLISRLPLGHRQLFILRDANGESLRIEMLSTRSSTQAIEQQDLDKARG